MEYSNTLPYVLEKIHLIIGFISYKEALKKGLTFCVSELTLTLPKNTSTETILDILFWKKRHFYFHQVQHCWAKINRKTNFLGEKSRE